MIDPMLSMAFAVHGNKGVYALLLGSGVSRKAQIPTGWEIVKDLIEKLARLRNEEVPSDPLVWYRKNFQTEPNYSDILDELGNTPAERQALLRSYFEPNEDERKDGKKAPTQAHRAIARLVRDEYIRVILTTNFDKLIEQAIQTEGITPTVISTADAIEGAEPLAHAKCHVIKLHGDYLDLRIKNTEKELANYGRKVDRLLDRVFDEFGLIICGWSADWDIALRRAMERCPSRRYSTFWTARPGLTGRAKTLADLRRAVPIKIKDADSFFTDLSEKVQSLAALDRPHPLSAKVAVESLKRYLQNNRYISVRELVFDAVESVRNAMAEEPLSILAGDAQRFRAAVGHYDAACGVVASLLAVGGYYGGASNIPDWCESIERLARVGRTNGFVNTTFLALRRYPAMIAMYATGMGALARENYETLAGVFLRTTTWTNDLRTSVSVKEQVVVAASAWKIFWHEGKDFLIDGQPGVDLCVSRHMRQFMRDSFRSLIPDDSSFDELFDRFECILAMVHADFMTVAGLTAGGPMGVFCRRHRFGGDLDPLKRLAEEIVQYSDNHPLLLSGFFNKSLQRLSEIKTKIDYQAVLEANKD